MQPVERKKRKPIRHARVLILASLLLVLGGSVAAWYSLSRPEETETVEAVSRGGTIYAASEEDVAALRITLRSGESWLLTQAEDGSITVDGEENYQAAERVKTSLLSAASMVTYEDVLTEVAADYAESYPDFGLDTPRVMAEIVYRDGTEITLRIGDSHALEESGWSYMLIDGDPRLFALDNGTVENLAVRKDELHPVVQPTLHKARFDRITFTGADGEIQAQWVLQGDIGGDAEDRWMLTVPLSYPAEGENMSNLQDNLENLHLGAYVAEATEENLTTYGFDTPSFVIEIHMAEGQIGTTNSDGEYEVTSWPESTVTFTVGGAKSEYVDYVQVEDSIYLTSHFTLATLMDMDPTNTLTRYVAPTALGNLAQLIIADDSGTETYVLTRTEQVAENNDLVYDEDGNVAYDITCTRNGADIAYSSFEAAYNDLLVVTVSGSLPQGWTATDTHTCYTFIQSDGTQHTLALADYDALHDAVILDGNALFYLIKGGMKFNLE